MKSVIILILVLLLFTYSHATDSTDNMYRIEGVESIPHNVQVGFKIEHQFKLNNDFQLNCPDWSLISHGVAPRGYRRIDRYGKFRFIPNLQDAGKIFYFRAMVKSCGEILTEFEFSIKVFDEILPVIQIEENLNVLMGKADELSIYKNVGDIAIKEIDLIVGYDKKGLHIDTIFTDSLLKNGICNYSIISDSLDSIQLVRIKASTNNTSQADKTGSLIKMKIRSLYYSKYECGIFPINFYWTDCKQNYVVTEDDDTLYLMVDESKYCNIKDIFITDIKDYLNFDFLSNHPFQLCYQDKELKSINYIFYKNGGLGFIFPCQPDDRGDVNINGIHNEIADIELLYRYILWGDSVFTISTEDQLAESDLNYDKEKGTLADLVCMTRIITGDTPMLNKFNSKGCKIFASFNNNNLSTKAGFPLGAVLARFKTMGKYKIINETDMQLDYVESDDELKVLVWQGLVYLRNSIPCGINNLFRVEGDVELIAVEASDYNGNVMCVDLK